MWDYEAEAKARVKAIETAKKILELAEQRASGKLVNAIVVGQGDKMTSVMTMAIPEENGRFEEIRPDTYLRGELGIKPGIMVITDNRLGFNVAVVGWWDGKTMEEKWPELTSLMDFGFAAVHLAEVQSTD